MDIRGGVTAITGVAGYALPKEFLDGRNERMLAWEIKSIESIVCGFQTPREWTCVVALWRWNLLLVNLLFPEGIDRQRLRHPERRQICIRPCGGTVAVQFAIIAIPSRCSVEGLSIVMKAVTVSAHEKDLVLDIPGRISVQLSDLMSEASPLSIAMPALEALVSRIAAVDQAEVFCCEVEGAWVG